MARTSSFAAYGIEYISCPRRGALRAGLERTLASSGPTICAISGQTDQALMPGVPSKMLPGGTMVSAALHEMAPFLPEEEVRQNMAFID